MRTQDTVAPVEAGGDGAPGQVLWAAAIVALEGLALVVLGPILLVGGIVRSSADSLGRAWAEVGIAIAAGIALLFLGRALSQLATWSKGPIVVIQLLAAPVGYSLAIPSDQPRYGIPILVAVVTVLYLLFTTEARVALERRDRGFS